MANQFLNATEYANSMLLMTKNMMVLGRLVDGQFKNEMTDENGLKINVKRPPRFLDKKNGLNASLQTQDIVTGSVSVNVTEYSKVHISVGDIEYIANYNALMQNKTMKAAASRLAHSIDSFLAAQTLKFPNWTKFANDPASSNVETSGTTSAGQLIHSPLEAFPAHTRLMDMGVPNESLNAVVSFADGEKIRGSLTGGFIQGVNKTALENVKIPVLSEIDWYATQQLPVLTTGTRSATADDAQINNGTLNVNYRDVKDTMTQVISIDGLAGAATIKAGEVLTIAGVYAYDWRALQVQPYLQQFRVVSDVTLSGGAGDVTIYPAIIVPGTNDGISTDANTAFATCSAAAVDGANVNFVGAASTAYRIKSAFHKTAISLVSAKLYMPFTGVASFATDPETGISIRYWRGSDITTGAHVHRWDCVYGAEVMDPFLGTRISGVASEA